jgi:hypothetical protein
LGRAKLIVEYLSALPDSWREDIEKNSKWIYCVVPENDFIDGYIKSEETTDNKIENVEKNLKAELAEMKNNITEMRAGIERLHQTIVAALSSNSEKPVKPPKGNTNENTNVTSSDATDSGKDDSIREAVPVEKD